MIVNIKNICSYIKHFNIVINNNYLNMNFEDEFTYAGDVELTKKAYSSYLRVLSKTYGESKVQSMLLEEFLNQNKVISINVGESNKNEIDGCYEDDKKIVINFLNNKKVIIYDKDFMKEVSPFISEIQNQLIDNKLYDNSKGKVLKYERNNNGKNGKFM